MILSTKIVLVTGERRNSISVLTKKNANKKKKRLEKQWKMMQPKTKGEMAESKKEVLGSSMIFFSLKHFPL